LQPGHSLISPKLTLSVGSSISITLHAATQARRPLALTAAGLLSTTESHPMDHDSDSSGHANKLKPDARPKRSTALLRSSRCRLKPVQRSRFNGVKADARSKSSSPSNRSSRSCLESKAWPRSILLRTPGMTAHGSFACCGWLECQVNSPALVRRAVQWLRRSYEPIKTRPDGS
jgi:hypothetical protein